MVDIADLNDKYVTEGTTFLTVTHIHNGKRVIKEITLPRLELLLYLSSDSNLLREIVREIMKECRV